MDTISFSVRVDSNIKKQCEGMYGELGIDLNTAINVFLNKSLYVGGFSFDVNKEIMAAMLGAEYIEYDLMQSIERFQFVTEFKYKFTKKYKDKWLYRDYNKGVLSANT